MTELGTEPEWEQQVTNLQQLCACLTSACKWFPSWEANLHRALFNTVALANMEALVARLGSEEAAVLASLAGL